MTTLLFLPVTRARLAELQQTAPDVGAANPAQPTTLHEAVAALAAYKILVGLESGKSAEIVLAHTEQSLIAPLYESAAAGPEQAEQTRKAAVASLMRQSHKHVPGNSADQRLRWLDQAGVRPMAETDIEREAFLTPVKHLWRFEYRQRETTQVLAPVTVTGADGSQRPTTKETGRAASRLAGDFTEGGTIQGVAGCGKTQMMTDAVANTARSHSAQVLVLTLTEDQRRASYQRLKDNGVQGLDETVQVRSLRNLLMALVIDQTRIGVSRSRFNASYRVSEARIAEVMGIHPLGNLNAREVVRAAISQVNRFCYSADVDLTPEHCPEWVGRDPNETRIITECARRYWQMLQEPAHTQTVVLPLRLQHLWKIAELNDVRLPHTVASVFVDEAHDVPPALLRWLNGHTHLGVWLLGDEFQHYGRNDRPFFQRGGGYQHRLTHSYRCSRAMEDVINPLLSRHPANEQAGIEFEGHPNSGFRLRWHTANTLPSGPSVVVCANELDCLEHFLRLNHAGVGVTLMGRTAMDVPAYLRSLVGLYIDGQRPRAPNLWRYTDWGQLQQDRGANPSFQRIQDMLARGFSHGDCDRICQAMGRPARAGDVHLALPATIKNHQFPRVELSRALLAGARPGKGNPSRMAEALSQIYTAETRATRELVLPGEYRDWLSD